MPPLVDHMQTVMTTADTYGGLEELEDLLNDYQRAKGMDAARTHQLEHLIQQAIDHNRFRQEVEAAGPDSFENVVIRCHELLSLVRNSQTRVGMHVFRPAAGGR